MRKKEKKIKIKKTSFARHSPRRSFLTVSLYGSIRKEVKKSFARHSPRFCFLTVFLYGTMRSSNITHLPAVKT